MMMENGRRRSQHKNLQHENSSPSMRHTCLPNKHEGFFLLHIIEKSGELSNDVWPKGVTFNRKHQKE
jgi:hypothetical protein